VTDLHILWRFWFSQPCTKRRRGTGSRGRACKVQKADRSCWRSWPSTERPELRDRASWEAEQSLAWSCTSAKKPTAGKPQSGKGRLLRKRNSGAAETRGRRRNFFEVDRVSPRFLLSTTNRQIFGAIVKFVFSRSAAFCFCSPTFSAEAANGSTETYRQIFQSTVYSWSAGSVNLFLQLPWCRYHKTFSLCHRPSNPNKLERLFLASLILLHI